MLVESRGGCWIPWSWSYTGVWSHSTWVLVIKLLSSGRAKVFLTTEPSPKPVFASNPAIVRKFTKQKLL